MREGDPFAWCRLDVRRPVPDGRADGSSRQVSPSSRRSSSWASLLRVPSRRHPRADPRTRQPGCSRSSTTRRSSPSSGTRPRTTSAPVSVSSTRSAPPSDPPGSPSTSPARMRRPIARQVDDVTHVHVRERQPRPVQRAAGERVSSGVPRPDVRAGGSLVGTSRRAGAAHCGGRPHGRGAGRGRRRRGPRAGGRRRGRPGRAGPRAPASARPRPASTRPSACSPAEPAAACATTTVPGRPVPSGRSSAAELGPAALRAAQSQARQALPVGRRGPGQLRLLRPHVVGLPAGRRHAAPVEQPAGADRQAGVLERPAARGPRLLLPARSATSASTSASGKMINAPQTGDVVKIQNGVGTARSAAPGACSPRPRPLPGNGRRPAGATAGRRPISARRGG